MTTKKNEYKYAFIGAGNMAIAIIRGILINGESPKNIIASTKTKESANKVTSEFKIKTTLNNNDCLNSEIIILSIKPQVLPDIIKNINTKKLAEKLIISVIAGIPCHYYFKSISNKIKIIRAMPNMPAKIGQGITGLYSKNCSENDKIKVTRLISYIGKVLWLKTEEEVNFVNAISGSGPAYVYLFIQQLAKAGTNLGLTYEESFSLTVQTVLGATNLVDNECNGTQESVEKLISKITSKGGTTFAAIKSFEKDNFATIIDNAVKECHQRAIELSKDY